MIILAKNLNNIERNMSFTKLSGIDINPKQPIKLSIAKLDKTETYPKNEKIPEDALYRY